MRACFLGQNIFALGNGIAVLQSPPLVIDDPKPHQPEPAAGISPGRPVCIESALAEAPVKPER